MFNKKCSVKDRVIWVTGASYGIGAAVAKELGARGAKLVISARSEEKLEKLAQRLPTKVLVAPMDVTDKQANIRAVQKAVEHFGGLDIAILNVGISEYIDPLNFDADVCERVMHVNYVSMMYGIEAALPELFKSDIGQLVGLSSVAGFNPLPRAEAYGASKAAIRYTLEALRMNLKIHQKPLDISVVCPGFVRTPLTDKNDFPMPMRIEPEKAARFIVDGIEKRKKLIHFPFLFTQTLRAFSLLPRGLYEALVVKALRKRT